MTALERATAMWVRVVTRRISSHESYPDGETLVQEILGAIAEEIQGAEERGAVNERRKAHGWTIEEREADEP